MKVSIRIYKKLLVYNITALLRDVFSQLIIKVDSLLMKASLLALCLNC